MCLDLPGHAHPWTFSNSGQFLLSFLPLLSITFHQTVIVIAGHHLAKLGLNQALEATLLIAITFAACFATYAVVSRVAVLRLVFGLKVADRRAQPAAASLPPAAA